MHDVLGQEAILSFFDRVIDNGSIGHAYCLTGPQGIGKKDISHYVAARLLETTEKRLMVHPDYRYLDQEINLKTDKTKMNIDVDQVRGVITTMSRAAAMGGYKVAIINRAHKLSAGAGSALLKTLEEPTKQTVLMLLADDEYAILPTIRSRAHMIRLRPVGQDVLIAYAKEQGIERERAVRMAVLSRGLPRRFKEWMEDEISFDEYEYTMTDFVALSGKRLHEKLAIVEPFFGDKTDHILERDKLALRLSAWQAAGRDMLVASCTDKEPLPFKWNKRALVRVIDLIEEGKELLQKNIHPRLVVEHILLYIP